MLTDEETAFFETVPPDVVDSTVGSDLVRELKALGDIKCKFCQGSNVIYRLLQTRSADEGMTTFFNCSDCGRCWTE
tara:strand:- start:379 stop:606 length:228 start_codon:yes stop_codon:yes gene_type:complete